ncbi:hypothetical protein [Propionivibrio sp.]|uniref:hypothetical protein n=1 Tax=Propionivibrio sp. TaxID=2212460 RepID=UPI003BF44B24
MPRSERWAFGGALLLYVIAKFAELNDHQIAALLGAPAGQTLKHLLATGATAGIVGCLVRGPGTLPGGRSVIKRILQ